jgi:hypothetical protein
MQRLTNRHLEALETAWRDIRRSDCSPHFWPGNSFDPAVQFMFMAHNALPALLAELRELRRLTAPEPISDKHRDGNWWLVWEPGFEHWLKARWRHETWDLGWQNLLGTPTYALPLPGRPEPPAARGEE